MVASARSFALEDSFLEPQVLDPPPTRHALFILLLALAAVLHLGTAGWGDLYDGVEGQFAGGAREMLATQQWLVPTNNGVPQLQTPPPGVPTVKLPPPPEPPTSGTSNGLPYVVPELVEPVPELDAVAYEPLPIADWSPAQQ